MSQVYDAVVVGAGFGGLGAALALVRGGARVALCETLSYPGGCASTFRKDGYAFEAGATLFSGLGEAQLFGRWVTELRLDVQVQWPDPLVELRTPTLRLPVHRDKARFVAELERLPGAPVGGLRRFFRLQEQVASALWPLFDDPRLLPPLDLRALLRHGARALQYAPLVRWMGRPLQAVLAHCGLEGFRPLRTFLDALCQITVQCPASEAEAPFALAALDYYWRGTGHVRGGIGRLAEALVEAVRAGGGEVLYANRVKALAPAPGGGWRVHTRRGELRARHVLANVLPQGLQRLLPEPGPRAAARLTRLAREVDGGWGAAMLYLVSAAPPGVGAGPRHLELVQDEAAPFVEGNHLFVSVSSGADEGRAPAGLRTLTVSTHVPLQRLRALEVGAHADYVARVQARMREGLARLAPEWMADVRHALTASPRTFARCTQREGGAVGGVPRRAGLHHYRTLSPRPVQRGLWLVGDSVFPGQSTLATALGGVRTAAAVLGRR